MTNFYELPNCIRVPSYIPLNPPEIAFIGEAPGADEIRFHLQQQREHKVGWPFVGNAGRRFTMTCNQAGIDRFQQYVGNVFSFRPVSNKLASIGVPRREAEEQFRAWRNGELPLSVPIYAVKLWEQIALVPPATGLYIPSALLPEIARLWEELRECNPRLLVPMGNTALWAIGGRVEITKARGAFGLSLLESKQGEPFKMLPTFHPQNVEYQPKNASLFESDFRKAAAELDGSLLSTSVVTHVPTNYEEAKSLFDDILFKSSLVAVDIETPWRQRAKVEGATNESEESEEAEEKRTNGDDKFPPVATRETIGIKTIGFAGDARKGHAVVIQFFSPEAADGCFFTEEDHRRIVALVRELLGLSRIKKVFQYGLFDVEYLWHTYGMRIRGWEHDTRVLASALDPGQVKGLGTLASVYLNLNAWKLKGEH